MNFINNYSFSRKDKIIFLRKTYWNIYRYVLNILYKIYPSAKILLYHKVDNIKNDSHKLAVTPENFLKQISYVKNMYHIINLKQLQKCINNKKIMRKSVVITFDDGYLDNYKNVYPIIKRLKIPITIFVSNFGKTTNKELLSNNTRFIKEMDRGGLVTIASHTFNHQKLSFKDIDEQKRDIYENRKFLENIINKKVDSFAYPFGQKTDYTEDTIKILKKLGFKISFTAYLGIITRFSNKFTLPRYVVKNWNLHEFKVNVGL